ncbi:hypothetical protein L249_0344 [Ophiocordyceps polyrhachis-furcata BCC 54312]|uniref:Uncharacterized protein n=1 Tax=Ophiocordyceps polyrhachis-furcata BCC 54312 TaxID=1330021 RepID=A0A367LEQ3_9HYPO|nr:hypothetical protein L249_0344 [Ophiocordyceps polyrhachis-furcata BCC 54312]
MLLPSRENLVLLALLAKTATTMTPAEANPNQIGQGYGCVRGYMFYGVNGWCCTRDFATVTWRRNKIETVRCLPKPEYDLGEEKTLPEHLKGVRHCRIDAPGDVHDCPLGKQVSAAATARIKQPGAGCCADHAMVRDSGGVCQKLETDFRYQSQSDEYWRRRLSDGCRREGFWGPCCDDKNFFRESYTRVCDRRLWSRVLGRSRRAYVWEIEERRRSDGCTEL